MRIRLALGGYALPCGCVVGVYEAYDGTIIGIVDVPAEACKEHRAGSRIAAPPTSV